GAGQGIGLAIGRTLAGAGARVVVNDLNPELAHRAARTIGDECIDVPGDCSDPDVIDQLVDAAVTAFGHLDIAIANAGITLFGEFLSYTPDDFYRVMKVNLGGTFFLAQAAARQMKKQGTGGKLL